MKPSNFYKKCGSLFVFGLVAWQICSSQNTTNTDTTQPLSLLTPAPSFHKARTYTLAGLGAASYASTLIVLNEFWYKNFDRTRFHFFNDNDEWLQMDKVGHFHTSYFMGVWSNNLLEWAGNKDQKALWYGGMTGSAYLLIIEFLDGFSVKWGASWGDLAANTLGSAWMIGQEKLWNEQRITVKYSFHRVNYAADVQSRADNLYGKRLQEQLLKDYNGQTYWLSANIESFIPRETKFPDWLSLAVGYGAEGMLGGERNVWKTDDGTEVDRTDIPRYRQYFLSLDIDWTRIPTNSKALQTLFKVVNIIKLPAPALEYNRKDHLKAHLLYF